MRVAYVCTDPGVAVFGGKGGSVHAQEIVAELVRRGAEVTVLARRLDGECPAALGPVRVRALTAAPKGDTEARERFLLAGNTELRSALEEESPFDLVYERHALWSYAAMEHAAGAGIPGLLEVNAPLVDEQRRFRSLVLVREAEEAADRCFAAASALMAVSGPLASWLRAKPAAAGRVHVVPNGVDVERFRPGIQPAVPAPEGIVTIGFVGSLRPWHGVETLAEAFGALRGEGWPVRLVVVGDGPARATLEACRAERLGTVVLTGAVDPAVVPAMLASMDIATAPYPTMDHFYFSPLKVFEYMASGRAIVASGAGQVGEVIEDEVTGLLHKPGDVEGMRVQLRRLVADAELGARLGRAARRSAVREHCWSRAVDRILSLARLDGRVPA